MSKVFIVTSFSLMNIVDLLLLLKIILLQLIKTGGFVKLCILQAFILCCRKIISKSCRVYVQVCELCATLSNCTKENITSSSLRICFTLNSSVCLNLRFPTEQSYQKIKLAVTEKIFVVICLCSCCLIALYQLAFPKITA